MKIGIFAFQGAFAEHARAFAELGVQTTEIRRREHFHQSFDGVVLPGGESTVQGKLLRDGNAYLGTMDITVKRNAYGRQIGSFRSELEVKEIGNFPAVFIRAPYIESAGKDVKILAEYGGKAVAARQAHMLVTAFHPELTDDLRIHAYFTELARGRI